MSRHESVSCDSCMKANFKGRRYKCLVCYDYDLCATCHESGVTAARHSTSHPMQCILTRSDFELYYGGDSVSSDQPQSFTCPYCGEMGFTESSLSDHVTSQHNDNSTEVICPICAALPGGDPNMISDDFHTHLAMEHRGRETFEVDTMVGHRTTRRLAGSRRGARARHFTSVPVNTTAASNSSSIAMDPIAELLSHLSGVHTRLNMRAPPHQLRDLQMQLDPERALRIPDSLSSYREHIQRLPRRGNTIYEPASVSASASNASSESGRASAQQTNSSSSSSANKSLLSRYLNSEKLSGQELEKQERVSAEHSLFVQDILLASLTDHQLTVSQSASEKAIQESSTETASIASLLDQRALESSVDERNESMPSVDHPATGS